MGKDETKKCSVITTSFGKIAVGVVLAFFLLFGGVLSQDVFAETVALTETQDQNVAYSYEEASAIARRNYAARNPEFEVRLCVTEAITGDSLQEIVNGAYIITKNSSEGDYLKNSVVQTNLSTRGTYSGGLYSYTISFKNTYRTTTAQEAELDDALKTLYSQLKLDSMTDMEKLEALYGYIADNIKYDYSHLNDSSYYPQFTAHAALIEGKAVCQGIAMLFYKMLVDQGFEVRIVDGYGLSNTGISGSHAWNIVKVGELWYFADPTWDVGGYRDFFLYGSENDTHHQLSDKYTTEAFQAQYPISPISYQEYAETHFTGWKTEDGNTYYYVEGQPVTGLKQIDGKKYYFDAKGVMVTGFLKKSGKIYYFDADGVMATGWTKFDDQWRYFSAKGVMTVGWVTKGGKTYYFNTNGIMQTGWKKIGTSFYFFTSKGLMHTGWLKYKGSKYYLKEDGTAAIGEKLTIDSVTYKFNKKGVCLNPPQ